MRSRILTNKQSGTVNGAVGTVYGSDIRIAVLGRTDFVFADVFGPGLHAMQNGTSCLFSQWLQSRVSALSIFPCSRENLAIRLSLTRRCGSHLLFIAPQHIARLGINKMYPITSNTGYRFTAVRRQALKAVLYVLLGYGAGKDEVFHLSIMPSRHAELT